MNTNILVALFIIPPNWKQSKHPPTGERIMLYSPGGTLLSNEKKLPRNANHGRISEILCSVEEARHTKNIHCMISYLEHSRKDKSALYSDRLEANDYIQRDWGTFRADGNILQLCGIIL